MESIRWLLAVAGVEVKTDGKIRYNFINIVFLTDQLTSVNCYYLFVCLFTASYVVSFL